MASSRRLRRLVPDQALLERRVAGEPLRDLARDYGVAHTTLIRYFRRPEVVVELGETRRRLRAERKALAAQRRLEREVRRRAREQAARDRELEALSAALPPWRSGYEDWPDRHELPNDVPSTDDYSANDRRAEKVVVAGGGVEQVIEATGLRSRENVYRTIDAQLVARALDNDDRRAPNDPPETSRLRLRRLVPDDDLISRRAEGEALRDLAADYDVSHTTLSRYFKRPEVAKELKTQPPRRHSRPTRLSELTPEIQALIDMVDCPLHHRRPITRPQPAPGGSAGFAVMFCCERPRRDFLRRLRQLDHRQTEAVSPPR